MGPADPPILLLARRHQAALGGAAAAAAHQRQQGKSRQPVPLACLAFAHAPGERSQAAPLRQAASVAWGSRWGVSLGAVDLEEEVEGVLVPLVDRAAAAVALLPSAWRGVEGWAGVGFCSTRRHRRLVRGAVEVAAAPHYLQ